MLARLAHTEFGLNRLWTQIALESRAAAGTLSHEGFFKSSAELVGWGYWFTSPSSPMLLHAAMLAGWNQNARPLKQALEQLGDESIGPWDALKLVAGFLPRAYREIVLPEQRAAVTASVLKHLADRLNGMEGVKTLLSVLGRTSPSQMGLYGDLAKEMFRVTQEWVANRERRLVVL